MKLAYQAVGTQIQVVDSVLQGGFETLNILETVFRRWPLAKLTFSLQKMIFSLDRLLQDAAGKLWHLGSTIASACLPSVKPQKVCQFLWRVVLLSRLQVYLVRSAFYIQIQCHQFFFC